MVKLCLPTCVTLFFVNRFVGLFDMLTRRPLLCVEPPSLVGLGVVYDVSQMCRCVSFLGVIFVEHPCLVFWCSAACPPPTWNHQRAFLKGNHLPPQNIRFHGNADGVLVCSTHLGYNHGDSYSVRTASCFASPKHEHPLPQIGQRSCSSEISAQESESSKLADLPQPPSVLWGHIKGRAGLQTA